MKSGLRDPINRSNLAGTNLTNGNTWTIVNVATVAASNGAAVTSTPRASSTTQVNSFASR
jgi:hypothetical protein